MSEFQQVVEEGKQAIAKKIRRFFLILFLLSLAGGGVYLLICNWTYSEGQRAGTLIKISNKGVVFKTYEGQLNLGGIAAGNEEGMIGNIWSFSVWKNDIYHQLQDYQGQRVKLYYREKLKAMPWQGKTNYFVYRLELVTEKNE